MLWTLILVLIILWILGFNFKVGGGLIHTLLVIALILVIVNLLT
ncbi:MAG: lmo0937 family membrane protein [Candidatus Paceibacterota bacterium]